MFSCRSNFHISLAFECALAFLLLSVQRSSFVLADANNGGSGGGGVEISLSQLYSALSGEPLEFFQHHVAFMFTVASYGDTLYNTSQGVSGECAATAKAVMRMMERLKMAQQVDELTAKAISGAAPDVADAAQRMRPQQQQQPQPQQQQQHPLELVCRRVDTLMANSSLGGEFEAAKAEAKLGAGGAAAAASRPPYLATILGSLRELGAALPTFMAHAELTRSVATGSFAYQMNKAKAASNRYQVLARSAAIVAQKPQFADAMQAVYEKTLDQVVPQMVADRKQGETKNFWFVPKMMRIFYGLIAQNSVLKDELDRTAAIVGKDYAKSDLEFSTI